MAEELVWCSVGWALAKLILLIHLIFFFTVQLWAVTTNVDLIVDQMWAERDQSKDCPQNFPLCEKLKKWRMISPELIQVTSIGQCMASRDLLVSMNIDEKK